MFSLFDLMDHFTLYFGGVAIKIIYFSTTIYVCVTSVNDISNFMLLKTIPIHTV
jgi:hypothetical protein